MTYRVEAAAKLELKEKSKVLVCDVDTIFKKNPFHVFKENDNLVYTTRYYRCRYPVNAGVWGFVKNKQSDEANYFIVNELNNPQWEEFKEFTASIVDRKQREDADWYLHQDILCTIHESTRPPTKAKFRDIGYKYNFCPQTGPGSPGDTLDSFLQRVYESDPAIIHFKEFSDARL